MFPVVTIIQTADYLIEIADRCIRLANAGRRLADELDSSPAIKEQRARLAASGREVADELETMSREMMAKAVELDTSRQKASPRQFGP